MHPDELMSTREAALEAVGAAGHAVQLYTADSELLGRNVGEYLQEGLIRGEGLLVIAARQHRQQFVEILEELGADTRAAAASGQLTLLDADQTLSRFIGEDGTGDWEELASELRSIASRIRGAHRGGLRAYGEMVGVLWANGRYASAIRLEKLWNGLLEENRFSLYCGYPIDIFGSEFQLGAVEALLCAHTHLVPGAADAGLDGALRMAMDEVLGRRAEGIRALMSSSVEVPGAATMPGPEPAILWLRSHVPDEADRVLAKARQYYQGSRRLGTRGSPVGVRS
jgi:hypothetical protein